MHPSDSYPLATALRSSGTASRYRKTESEMTASETREGTGMSESKNPYPSDTPEWQLFENMVSSARCSTAFATDAGRTALSKEPQS